MSQRITSLLLLVIATLAVPSVSGAAGGRPAAPVITPSAPTVGERLVASGTIERSAPPRPVALQVKRIASRSWKVVATGSTDRRGVYTLRGRAPASAGVAKYRVVAQRVRIRGVLLPRVVSRTRVVAVDSAQPTPPRNLTAQAGDGQVRLSWDRPARVDGLAGYLIYQRTGPAGEVVALSPTPRPGREFRATGLTNGTTYFFAVVAVDARGKVSGPSNVVSAVPGRSNGDPVAPPLDVVVDPGDGEVLVSWEPGQADPQASGFSIYVATSPEGPWSEPIGTPPLRERQVVNGLTNDVTYFFRVTAVTFDGRESPASETVSATPRARRMVLVDLRPSGSPASEARESALRDTVDDALGWFADQTVDGAAPRFGRTETGQVAVNVLVVDKSAAEVGALTLRQVRDLVVGELGLRRYETPLVFADVREASGAYCGISGGDVVYIPERSCDIHPTVGSFPYGATYLTAHELTHILGAVPDCAPHTVGGHVGDSPADILYSGDQSRDWANLTLDVGRDDYYLHDIPGCPDIADSSLWDR